MIKRVFTLSHTDDYRSGPRLDMTEGEHEEAEDSFVDTFLVDEEGHFYIYQVTFPCGEPFITCISRHDTFEDAEKVVEKYYYKITGDYPFRQDGGTTGFYHLTGKRERQYPPSPRDEGEESSSEDDEDDVNSLQMDEDGHEYLVIISKDSEKSFSLNPFAVW